MVIAKSAKKKLLPNTVFYNDNHSKYKVIFNIQAWNLYTETISKLIYLLENCGLQISSLILRSTYSL